LGSDVSGGTAVERDRVSELRDKCAILQQQADDERRKANLAHDRIEVSAPFTIMFYSIDSFIASSNRI
jgi:hypothetical protein